ncbi:XF1762 family protein [Paenibacillus sp. MCAF9]|uniref:XF1762 family protein n=1 Tax=Paenibacillus sp. MCAF9 TaxID=3233046 RepID=UPI003F965A77
MLETQPIVFSEACEFVKQHHRHHIPPQGHKFSIAVADADKVVGVVMVGRPVARSYDNGRTLEVIRCCTDGTKNAASKLYAAAWTAAKAMGYRRLVTYTLVEEPGTSLRAAGWKALHQTRGGSWDTPTRPRIDKHPTGQKTLWEFMAE